MKSYKLLWLYLLVITSLLLTACGGVTQVPTEKQVTEPPATEKVSVDVTACHIDPPASPSTINVFGWPFAITEFYADEFKKCGEVENIDVNVQLLDFTSVTQAVNLALSSGGKSPYDIVHGSNPEIVTWASKGWLLPLNDLIDKYREEYDLDDINSVAYDGVTIDGKIYGFPLTYNTLHLYYRTDLFEKYNLQPPKTYDEVIKACEILKQEPDIAIPYGFNLSAGWSWEFEFWNFIRSFGGTYLNEDNTPAFNGPEGLAAANKMVEVQKACLGQEGATYSQDAIVSGFATGTIPFIQTWAATASEFSNPEQSSIVGKVGYAPAAAPNPEGPLGGSAWNDYYAIPATSQVDHDLAFRLIMEGLDKESMTRGSQVGLVTRKSISEGMPNLAAATETFNMGSGIYPPNPAEALAQAALWNWLPFIGTGEKTPQEALDAAAAEYTTEATKQGYIK